MSSADFRFVLVVAALIITTAIWDARTAGGRVPDDALLAEGRERIADLREIVDRADLAVSAVRAAAGLDDPAGPPPTEEDFQPVGHPEGPAARKMSALAFVPPPPDSPLTAEAETEAEQARPVMSPLDDPCRDVPEGRERAACWITAAYALFGGPAAGHPEQDVALAVAAHESGFRPLACNGDGGVSRPKGSCRRTGASGLFQQMPPFWEGRAAAALRTLAVDGTLDIFDGWHNTIVSVRLAAVSSWRTHWAACSDSVFGQGGTVRCGNAGGWL